jgi:MFS family permease
VLASGVMQVMNSTIGSSICSNAIPQIAEEFDITDETVLVLPISIFLIGYILGPLLWGPSSEYFGRKPPLLIAYCLFMVFTLACAVADSYASLLVFRLFNGMVASAPIATVGGLFADVHDDPTLRGRLMAYFMAVCFQRSKWRVTELEANLSTVYNLRANHRTLGIWLCCRCRLALVLLDWAHLIRS